MAKLTAINLDKERHLKYGFNSLIELEEVMGRPLTDLDDGVAMSDLRAIIYVGLKWEDSELTEESTGDLIDEGIENNENGMEYIGEVVGKAVQKSLGQSAFPSDK